MFIVSYSLRELLTLSLNVWTVNLAYVDSLVIIVTQVIRNWITKIINTAVITSSAPSVTCAATYSVPAFIQMPVSTGLMFPGDSVKFRSKEVPNPRVAPSVIGSLEVFGSGSYSRKGIQALRAMSQRPKMAAKLSRRQPDPRHPNSNWTEFSLLLSLSSSALLLLLLFFCLSSLSP